MLRAIAIDDEPFALEVIRQLCRDIPFVQLDNTFTNAHRGIEYLNRERPDLLFLDIKMPDISGLELLKQISPKPITIFTTAFSEHALKGFELDALDYLLKPFSAQRFLRACEKAKELFDLKTAAQANNEHIFIKTGYEQIKVLVNEILYIQSAGNYVQIVLQDQKITTRLTMAEAESLLPSNDFVRIHRSFIVAINHVDRLERGRLYCNGVELPIGAGYSQVLNVLFKN